MRSKGKNIWVICAFFIMIIGSMFLGISNVEGSSGGCVSAEMEQTDFVIEMDGEPSYQELETELVVSNDCGEVRNITIRFSSPDGDVTGATKEIVPTIYSDINRRNDRGSEHDVQVDPGETSFYLTFAVNDTTFADLYSMVCEIMDNDAGSSGDPAESIEVTVDVGEYNKITIEWLSKNEDEKTLVGGGTAEYYVELTNRGNIWDEEVLVQLDHDFPENITVSEIVGPNSVNYLKPESFGYDFTIVVRVVISVQNNTSAGTHEFNIVVWTPERVEPSGGQRFVSGELILQETGGPPPEPPEPKEKSIHEAIAIFGGGFVSILVVMVSLVYHFVLKSPIDAQDWKVDDGWAVEDEWSESHEGMGYEFDEPETPETLQRPLKLKEERAVSPPPPPMTPSSVAPVPFPPASVTLAPATQTPATPTPRKAAVVCPKCSVKITVSSAKRPLTVKCPKCTTKMTLKGKARSNDELSRSLSRSSGSPTRVHCPTCSANLRVTNPKRPLTIKCSGCETRISLKGKQGSKKSVQKKNIPSSSPRQGSVKRITCPGCSTKMKITNPARPLKVSCPSCMKKLNVK